MYIPTDKRKYRISTFKSRNQVENRTPILLHYLKGDKEIPIEGPEKRKEIYDNIIIFLKSKSNIALKLNEELLGRSPV